MSNQCHCKTKNGLGPQCKNNARSPTKYCHLHQECKYPINTKMSQPIVPRLVNKIPEVSKKLKPSLDLKTLAGKDITFVYNGEPVRMKSFMGTYLQNPVLTYGLNYVDDEKTKQFLKTWRVRPRDFNMAEQQWSIKDGKLYLENQENNSTSYINDVPNKQTIDIFKAATRALWCIFLHTALEANVINGDTIIELESRGILANIQPVEEGQALLNKFYQDLGFQIVDNDKQWSGIKTPIMQAKVSDVIGNICKKLPDYQSTLQLLRDS